MLGITQEDKDLLKDLNGRDPLGLMTVWQHRARDLVPSLSATSSRAEGFQVLLAALAWWPEFTEQPGVRPSDRTKYFMLVEQAFARATRFAGEAGGVGWPLPGTRRLYAGADGLWIGSKEEDHLLNNPLLNGVWGIYNAPSVAARLVDDQLIVDPAHADELRRETPVMRKLLPSLAQALSSGSQVTLAMRRDNQIVSGLIEILRNLPSRGFLRARLVEPATSSLTGALARLAAKRPQDLPRDRFLADAAAYLPAHASTLTQVLRCERLLASFEQVFEFACSAETHRTVHALAAALPVDLQALAQAQAAFAESGAYEGLSARRAEDLRAIDVSSKPSLLRGLLALHAKVSEARDSAPWITLSSGATLERAVALPPPATPTIDPATAWRNDYYLGTLSSLARQL